MVKKVKEKTVKYFLEMRKYMKSHIGYQIDKLKEFRPRHIIGKCLEEIPEVGVGGKQ